MILAGDVGGTKTALALFERRASGLALVREDVLPSHDFPSVEAVVARFLAVGQRDRIDAACFGVPGPVIDGRVTPTNLPWHVEERALAGAVGTPRVRLMNDLEAAGYGVLSLPASELAILQAGGPRPASVRRS
jgi:glucokinase